MLLTLRCHKGGEWENGKLSESGILIIHNEGGNVVFKNLRVYLGKLIIKYEIIPLYGNVVGAIVSISVFLVTNNYVIGNSNSSVLYLKDAISSALKG